MRPKKPRFPNRLIPAADVRARKLAKDVLHNPDQPEAEGLIGLAMWLESVASWRRERSEEDTARRARWRAQKQTGDPGQ